MWSVTLSVPRDAALLFQLALEPHCDAVAADETGSGQVWRVVGYCAAEPERPAIEIALSVAAAAAGIALPHAAVAPVPDVDWVAESRKGSPPVRVGRFCVYRGHDAPPPRDGRVALRIDASLAFGSGIHASTQGCLVALDRLGRRRRPRRVLDIGCGSGILAMAAARTWPARIVATDIDPVAARFAAVNAAANGLASRIEVGAGPGLRGVPCRARRFDLILGNIVVQPLAAMAPGLMRRLARGGCIVLSGLTRSDEAAALAAYGAQGGALIDRVRLGDWTTLVLALGGASRKIEKAPTRLRRSGRR